MFRIGEFSRIARVSGCLLDACSAPTIRSGCSDRSAWIWQRATATTARISSRASTGELFAINHSEQFEWDEIDGQIGFLLEREIDVRVPLGGDRFAMVCELPAVDTMATVVRIGLPELAHLATAELARWIEANGYRICGPNRELFLQRLVPDAWRRPSWRCSSRSRRPDGVPGR